MTKFTEKDMRAAIQAVAEGSSVNKAAVAHGVTRSTLQDRIKGTTAPRQANEHRQKLLPI
jgi:transposase-like protein